MAGNSSIRGYHAFPYPLKKIATSMIAYVKKGKKYGELFEHHYNFLLSKGIREQEDRAKEDLIIFLDFIKKNCHFYSSYLNNKYDLKVLPLFDKQSVNKHYNELFLEKPYFMGKSSGTTGQPLKVPYSKNAYQKEYAFWWYHRSFGNVHRGDRIATFAGHKIADVNRDKPPFWVMNSAENQMFFSSYHFSHKNMPHYLMILNKYRPEFIHGYPSSIYYVANYILNENIELNFRPKMIVTSSETTLDFQRQAIEKAFQCKVFIWYGNTEFCGHITECTHGKLHIQPYHSYVRVLKEDNTDANPGETGRIVATNFSNYSFALINYDMKDLVKISENQECSCDRGGMVLDYIHGRIEDYIITPEGRFVGRLDHLFKDAKYVRNGQIVQNDVKQVVIRIEMQNGFSQKIENTILEEARNRLGKTINIQFEYVKEIKKEPNGKFKFIVQNITTL